MSRLSFYADLSTSRFSTADGGAFTFPNFVQGDTLLGQVRLLDAIADSELREVNDVHVRSLRVSLGKVLEPATGGTFTLTFHGGSPATSAAIAFDATVETFTTATAAALATAGLTLGSLAKPAPGCWLVKLTGTESDEITLGVNALAPESFVRLRAFQETGVWFYEIRTIQSPLAFTGSFERVLAAAPSIEEVFEGRVATALEPERNEIQAIHVPRDFRGTYVLKFAGQQTRPLTIADGPAETTAALNALNSGGGRFNVTQGELDKGYIEFIGALAGAPQDEITVEVVTFDPGVLTFALPLDRAALNTALRGVAKLELTLEMELEVVDSEEDILNPAVSGRFYTIGQQTVSLVREQIFAELDEVPTTDYLRPPQPKNYQPRTTDQVLTGVQLTVVSVRGDGAAVEFPCDHGLGTQDIEQVTLINNVTGVGMVHGADFTWRLAIEADPENTVIVTTAVAPPLDGITILIKAPGPLNAYAAHTHTIADINILEARLAALEGRVDSLEDLSPTAPPARATERAIARTFSLDAKRGFLPAGRLPQKVGATPAFNQATDSLTDALLRNPPFLLPALHDASVTVAASLPGSPTVGSVYLNDTGGLLRLPGKGGIQSSKIADGAHFGYDGRLFYEVTKDIDPVATRSYYAVKQDVLLFRRAINERMLRAGQRFNIDGLLDLRTFAANTEFHWLLVIELGEVTQTAASSPATGENLEDVVWNADPLLNLPLILTDQLQRHDFGCDIIRAADGSFTSNMLTYGKWEVGGAIPSAPNFIVRGRLIQGDTKNAVSDPRGYAFHDFKGSGGIN